ncbi:MAG TPA: long-chain fatty acid--CoA ligase, partial [Oligoflexia bacterium]|nr:long-chain fatty acid--CoA ligase [Oligoflexia bacterium]
DQVNSNLANFESVKRFKILPVEFTVESGELTPSLKVKRKFCCEKYRAEIDSMYPQASAAESRAI